MRQDFMKIRKVKFYIKPILPHILFSLFYWDVMKKYWNMSGNFSLFSGIKRNWFLQLYVNHMANLIHTFKGFCSRRARFLKNFSSDYFQIFYVYSEHKYLWSDEAVFKTFNFIIVKLTKKEQKKVNFWTFLFKLSPFCYFAKWKKSAWLLQSYGHTNKEKILFICFRWFWLWISYAPLTCLFFRHSVYCWTIT